MTLEENSQILGKLNEWEAKETSLPSVLRLYRDLLLIDSEARLKIGIPLIKLDKEAIDLRLKEGRPLLDFESLAIDWDFFQGLVEKIVLVFERFPDLCGGLPDNLNETGHLKSMAAAWYHEDPLQGYQDRPDNRRLILHTALKPFLNATSEVLLKMVDQDRWRRGYCPVCGGSPDLAFLDKERGARYLVCSRCDAEWLFQRMECPSCGNQDQNTLAYFSGDSALYRLSVCESCKNYVKTVDLRCTDSQVLLPLERFLTLDLDAQAREKGYLQRITDRVKV